MIKVEIESYIQIEERKCIWSKIVYVISKQKNGVTQHQVFKRQEKEVPEGMLKIDHHNKNYNHPVFINKQKLPRYWATDEGLARLKEGDLFAVPACN